MSPNANREAGQLNTYAKSIAYDNQARETIQLGLKDKDPNTRRTAINALSILIPEEKNIRLLILDCLSDNDSLVQQAAANALGTMAQFDEEVRRALLAYWRRTESEDSISQIRIFLEAAGFNFNPIEKEANSFECNPIADKWKGKYSFANTIYACTFFGKALDHDSVLEIKEAASTLVDSKMIFVFIDQTPTEDGIIEIGALRSLGIQLVTIDDTVIQRGLEQQKEYTELDNHLSQFFLSGRNLYDVRDPVTDRLSFFGRELYARDLLDLLSRGRPIALFGLRKMGKSSLLQYLRDNAEFPVAYVDLDSGCDLADLFNRILKSWESAVRIKRPGLDWTPPILLSNPVSDPAIEFASATSNLMARLESKKYSRQLGLFVDEIELIAPKFSNVDNASLSRYLTFARTLRGLIQVERALALVIVGVDPRIVRIDRLEGEQNPFYQLFTEEYLAPLSKSDCIQMIRIIGHQMNLDYVDQSAEFIAEVSGGHPFVARQLCALIVDDLRQDKNDIEQEGAPKDTEKITLGKAKSVAERFIRDPATASILEESLWRELTIPELWPEMQSQENKAILTTLARVDHQPENVVLANGSNLKAREQSVFELKKRAVLDNDKLKDLLRIQMRLFQNWIKRYQLQEDQI